MIQPSSILFLFHWWSNRLVIWICSWQTSTNGGLQDYLEGVTVLPWGHQPIPFDATKSKDRLLKREREFPKGIQNGCMFDMLTSWYASSAHRRLNYVQSGWHSYYHKFMINRHGRLGRNTHIRHKPSKPNYFSSRSHSTVFSFSSRASNNMVLVFQEIRESPRKTKKPDVDFLSDTSPAQSALA